jgi:putative ABC transport system permease protein
MLVLETFFSHWRRHPGQLGTLVLGLALATALWSGVQAINEEARQSYARAAATLGANQLARLVHSEGAEIPVADYVLLRRAGWQVSPVMEGAFTLGQDSWRMIGVDPLTAPLQSLPRGTFGPEADIADFFGAPGLIFVAPDTILPDLPEAFPDIIENSAIAPGLMLTDIGTAARLLNRQTLSFLTVAPDQPAGLPLLAVVTDLRLEAPRARDDLSRLTDSFHLNLSAFGFLSFAVGLFIVHASIGLAFEQRRPVFRTLRAIGVPLRRLFVALAVEVTLIALIAGGAGVVLGYVVAAALLPDVAGTLRSLYGAEISGVLSFRPLWAVLGLAIAVLGAWISSAQSFWKLMKMPLLAPAQPRAWSLSSARATRRQAGVGLALLLASAGLAAYGGSLSAGFLSLGALLIGAALLLPGLVMLVLGLAEGRARTAFGEWMLADTRQLLPGLSLALMALLLALAANIGVSTMVGSFRLTFTGWLNQRLVSELYVTARSEAEAAQIREFLAPLVVSVLPIAHAETRIDGLPATVFGIADDVTYRDNWPLLETVSGSWDGLADGTLVMINEQMARRSDLSLGDPVSLRPGLTLPVGAIYSDYGNPNGQAMIGLQVLLQNFSQIDQRRTAVRTGTADVSALRRAVLERFDLPAANIRDQASQKQVALRVFEQTFRVTGALNVLTLAVAGFALLASLLTLANMRLPQVAPLWALGQTRATLARAELIRTVGIVAITWVIALPVGLALAWVLLAIVNVEAFGWRLPMTLFPREYLRLLGYAMLSSTIAAALPALSLLRMPPTQLLKVFSNER